MADGNVCQLPLEVNTDWHDGYNSQGEIIHSLFPCYQAGRQGITRGVIHVKRSAEGLRGEYIPVSPNRLSHICVSRKEEALVSLQK